MNTSTLSDERLEGATRLLRAAGFAGAFSLTPLAGGANNQVFRADVDGGPLVLKAYFQHPDDPRDRLGAEYSFSSFAWENGVRALPRPLACDRQSGFALYEYIPGRKLTPAEVTADAVAQALDFYLAVNALKEKARDLPPASEACFSLCDHWHCLQRRLRRLDGIEALGEVDREAAAFVQDRLVPVSAACLRAAADAARELGLPPEQSLPAGERCVSPSDFGFHNALRTPDGRMVFIDFEYAGWDDPAKTVSDFFCQPECPVPAEHYAAFARAVVENESGTAARLRRAELLLPIYRLKWCCIMLNDFLPAGGKRRRFAGSADEKERKSRQLRKARQALRRVAAEGADVLC